MKEALAYIATLTGPAIAVLAFILGIWYRVENKIDSARKEGQTAADKAEDKALAVEKQLSEFKLEVAKEYASWDTVSQIEERLTERMDSLSDQVIRMPDAVVDRITKFLQLKPTN